MYIIMVFSFSVS